MILWSNSPEAWHLQALLHWALRNGTFISAQAGVKEPFLYQQQCPDQQTEREGGSIFAAVQQQQKAGWKIQLRLFSSELI